MSAFQIKNFVVFDDTVPINNSNSGGVVGEAGDIFLGAFVDFDSGVSNADLTITATVTHPGTGNAEFWGDTDSDGGAANGLIGFTTLTTNGIYNEYVAMASRSEPTKSNRIFPRGIVLPAPLGFSFNASAGASTLKLTCVIVKPFS